MSTPIDINAALKSSSRILNKRKTKYHIIGDTKPQCCPESTDHSGIDNTLLNSKDVAPKNNYMDMVPPDYDCEEVDLGKNFYIDTHMLLERSYCATSSLRQTTPYFFGVYDPNVAIRYNQDFDVSFPSFNQYEGDVLIQSMENSQNQQKEITESSGKPLPKDTVNDNFNDTIKNEQDKESQEKVEKNSIKVKSSNSDIWNEEGVDEREKIIDFWASLSEAERNRLIKLEKESVTKKMKEQQKHSCTCNICGRRRTAIEEELEMLYDAYYEELEKFTKHRGEHGDIDFFKSFGNQSSMLSLTDDLMKNEGKKFVEMMEKLADKKIRKDYGNFSEHPSNDDGECSQHDEQKFENAKSMFQMFAAKMFEQRILAAYKEKMVLEKQRKLIEEEEELNKLEQQKKESRQRKRDKKKQKKKQKQEEKKKKELEEKEQMDKLAQKQKEIEAQKLKEAEQLASKESKTEKTTSSTTKKKKKKKNKGTQQILVPMEPPKEPPTAIKKPQRHKAPKETKPSEVKVQQPMEYTEPSQINTSMPNKISLEEEERIIQEATELLLQTDSTPDNFEELTQSEYLDFVNDNSESINKTSSTILSKDDEVVVEPKRMLTDMNRKMLSAFESVRRYLLDRRHFTPLSAKIFWDEMTFYDASLRLTNESIITIHPFEFLREREYLGYIILGVVDNYFLNKPDTITLETLLITITNKEPVCLVCDRNLGNEIMRPCNHAVCSQCINSYKLSLQPIGQQPVKSNLSHCLVCKNRVDNYHSSNFSIHNPFIVGNSFELDPQWNDLRESFVDDFSKPKWTNSNNYDLIYNTPNYSLFENIPYESQTLADDPFFGPHMTIKDI